MLVNQYPLVRRAQVRDSHGGSLRAWLGVQVPRKRGDRNAGTRLGQKVMP